MKKFLPLVLMVPMAFAAGAISPVGNQQPALDVSKSIGVVDIDAAFMASPLFLKGNEEIQKRSNAAYQQMEAEEKKLRILVEQRLAFEEGSDQSMQAELEIRAARARLQHADEAIGKMLTLEMMKLRDKAYVDLNQVIDKLAQERGLQLVLRASGMPDVSTSSLRERNERYGFRYVLFHHSAIDLTPEVIKILKSS